MNRPRPHETHRVWVCHSAHEHGACGGVLFRPGEGRLKTRGLSTKSSGVLPKSPQFSLGCSRVFHRTAIVCFQPCATFFDRARFFRSLAASFCFDCSFIICIFATIYIITERDHEKVIDFRRNSCRACAAQEGFHGIRLQSEKSSHSFFSPPLLPKATSPDWGGKKWRSATV